MESMLLYMTAFHLCMAGDSNARAAGEDINLLSYPEMNCHVQQLVLCCYCYLVLSPPVSKITFAYIRHVLGVMTFFQVIVASMEVVGMMQDIPFPSLKVTGSKKCYGGDPQGLKEAAVCGAVEKQDGNSLPLKWVQYIRVCPQHPHPSAVWLVCKIVLSYSTSQSFELLLTCPEC